MFIPTTKHRSSIFALGIALSAAAASPALATPRSIYDATGGTENGGDSFASGGNILVDQVSNAGKGNPLTSVTLTVAATQADIGSFDVVMTPVSKRNGHPGKRVVVATVKDSTLSTKFQTITVTPANPITVPARFSYFGIAKHPGEKSSVVLGNTLSPSVLNRPKVQAGADYYNNGGVQANSGGPYQIKVVVASSAANSN